VGLFSEASHPAGAWSAAFNHRMRAQYKSVGILGVFKSEIFPYCAITPLKQGFLSHERLFTREWHGLTAFMAEQSPFQLLQEKPNPTLSILNLIAITEHRPRKYQI